MNNLETVKDYLERFKLVFLYGLISCNDKEREVNLWKFFGLPAVGQCFQLRVNTSHLYFLSPQ